MNVFCLNYAYGFSDICTSSHIFYQKSAETTSWFFSSLMSLTLTPIKLNRTVQPHVWSLQTLTHGWNVKPSGTGFVLVRQVKTGWFTLNKGAGKNAQLTKKKTFSNFFLYVQMSQKKMFCSWITISTSLLV